MSVIAALLFATLSSINQLPTGAPTLQPSPSVTKFTFVVAGDNRPATRTPDVTQPLLDIVKAVAKNRPALIVWNGDTVSGKELQGLGKEYDHFLKAFASVQVPLFNAPGNHEMVNDIKCGSDKGEFPSHDLLLAYGKSMSSASGVFRYGNAAFVVVNTDDLLDVPLKNQCTYNGYVSKAQLKSLTDTLSALDADTSVTHIFLFMHRPIHDQGSHQIGIAKMNEYGTQVEAFRKAIDHGGYKKLLFVFASHDHRFYVYPNGASLSGTSPGSGGEPVFLITGGAGAPLAGCSKGGSGKDGAYYHYLSVAVDGANVTITPVPLYGDKPCTPPTG